MKRVGLSLLCLFTIMLTSCRSMEPESLQTLKQVTVALDWTPNTNHTGLYVAKNKGFFEAAGLDVSIAQPTENGAELLVASKKADFGISFQDSLASVYTQNLPVIAIGAVVAHNTSGLLTVNHPIDTPKQLEGLTYATWDLPIEQQMIKHIITADGGDANLLKMVPGTALDSVSALQTDIDVVWVFEGWDGQAVRKAELDSHFLAFRHLDPVFDYYTPVIIANIETVNRDKEFVQKFMDAVSKGYQYAIEHPEESAQILLTYVPELDADLVKMSQHYLTSYYKDQNHPWGYIDAERWNGFYQWLNDNHLVERLLKENEGFTNEFIKH